MSEEKKGVELLKKIIDLVVKDIKLGKEIAKDGFGVEDMAHLPAIIKSIQEIVEIAGTSSEIAAECKDIDASEVGVLLLASWEAYKEIAE